jgi:thioredoxin 2
MTNDPLHVVCPHCQVSNRVPGARLREHPVCGKCKSPLFAGKPVELDAAAFERHLTVSAIPLVVDFWAPWCGPCRAMAPQFERAARELEPEVRLAKVNTEVEQAIAARFGIRSIPTLIAFRNGREVARQAGAQDAASLMRWVRGALA